MTNVGGQKSVLMAGMGPSLPRRVKPRRTLREIVDASLVEGSKYIRRKLEEGQERSSRRRLSASRAVSSRASLPWYLVLKTYLTETILALLTTNVPQVCSRMLGTVRESYLEGHQRAVEQRITKTPGGRYQLPTFGVANYHRIIQLLHCLPQQKLALRALTLVLLCIYSMSGFSIATALVVYLVVEGHSAYNVVKKLICQVLDINYQEPGDPAFFLNPEIETVAWLNELISGMWANCLRQFVKDDVKKALNAWIPRWVARKSRIHRLLRYLKPKVLELDIGESEPWITAAKCYASDINLLNCNDESLTLDFGLVMHLQPNILVALNQDFSFGIHDLRLSAPMRIRFTPLLRDETLFGEVQFSFLTLPELDYDTSGVLGFLSLRLVKSVILYMVQETFRWALHPHKIVLPNPLVEDYKKHTLRLSEPLGILRMNLKAGANLQPTHFPILCIWQSQSDPYCILRLGPRAEKTAVIRKDSDPEWNHFAEFPITQQDKDFRQLKLYTMDFEWGWWKEDDQIGFTTISVRKVVDMGRVDEWYRLGSSSGEGALHVMLQFIKAEPIPTNRELPKTLRIPRDHRISQAILAVLVYEVQMSSPCTPMIVFEVSGRDPATTSPGHVSENWEFAEEFFFPIHNIDTDKVTISLVDFHAQVKVKAVTRRICDLFRKFFAEADQPQAIDEYNREDHYLLGEKTMDMSAFSGNKQEVNLESREGGIYTVLLVGKLYELKNQKFKVLENISQ